MKYDVKEIKDYTIDSGGVKARVSSYGCVLRNLWVEVDGAMRDVVLGYDDITDYFDNPHYFGCCVLPCANRIEGASFTLNGNTYNLEKNDGENNLHSGFESLSRKLWTVESISDTAVTFTIGSADGDLGMPGNRKYKVTYSVEGCRLRIDYECRSDSDTLFNPTNHSYFNLMGHNSGDILSHGLKINADKFTPTDEESICHGDIVDVKGTPMDFTKLTEIGKRINENYNQLIWGRGYDHNYVLNEDCSSPNDNLKVPAAVLTAPDNSLTLNVYTSAPCIQLYTANYLSDTDIGKSAQAYGARAGVALETQYAPNAINVDVFAKPILKKDEVGRSSTVYELKWDS